MAQGAVHVGRVADPLDLEPAPDPLDLQVHQVGGAVPQAWSGQRVAVDLQGHKGAGAVEAVADKDGGRALNDVKGDPLELGRVVAPARGGGRIDGGGGPAGGLGGQGGGGRVESGGQRAGRAPGRGQLGRGVVVEEPGVGVAGQERLRPQDPDQQVAVGDDAVELRAGQRRGQHPGRLRRGSGHGRRPWPATGRSAPRPPTRRPPRRRPGRRPAVAAGAGPDPEPVQDPCLGEEPGGRVLGVEAGLDGVAANLDLGELRQGEGLAGRDQELEADQVEAGDGFGDRVLDLDAGVDLEEPERSPEGSRRNSTVPAPT